MYDDVFAHVLLLKREKRGEEGGDGKMMKKEFWLVKNKSEKNGEDYSERGE